MSDHAPGVLYRKLLKTYLKKFDTNSELIVRSWRTTRQFFLRNATLRDPEDIQKAKQLALDVNNGILGGIITVHEKHADKGKKYLRITKEVLKASNNKIDPVSGQRFLHKYGEYINEKERDLLVNELKQAGIYSEKADRTEDLCGIKTRRRLVKDL
mmetsp:Transcript_40469/g.64011  ORF Transcript_40469/g.64011 Transcript_40469/m.64011 type:complete len:156 (-) Transcript_40469:78-545(-)|eukprot:CAMPEP_0201527492 /NCGR_PEP_ID=MMETSP0161_2-20130828/35350_1 /ASSEMBLY_ACC=CAM_ASM_000251 /TAXON_ID=180227 /ORGANISM="Neoparamoeba aestuarina, Strain SoJaBio B1-5/56/2" /LENGTH=155 /DNA_ID=CAMNT_0047928339 /DNA_START=38 /DNA_END=505 /DNA_ORIENTATION=+